MSEEDIIRDLRSQLRAKDLKLQDLRHKKNQQMKHLRNEINKLKTQPLHAGFQKLVEENKQLRQENKNHRRQIERQEIEHRKLRHENANWLKFFNLHVDQDVYVHYQKELTQ